MNKDQAASPELLIAERLWNAELNKGLEDPDLYLRAIEENLYELKAATSSISEALKAGRAFDESIAALVLPFAEAEVEVERFIRSNTWKHYCSIMEAEQFDFWYISTPLEDGLLRAAIRYTNYRQLSSAAPFVDEQIREYWKTQKAKTDEKVETDGDSAKKPRVSMDAFIFQILPACLKKAGVKGLPITVRTRPVTPKNMTLAASKLATGFFPEHIYTSRNVKKEIDVGSSSSPCNITIASWYDENVTFSGGKPTMFDKLVMEAFGALVECGNEWITDDMIYHTMTGSKGTVSQKARDQIHASMERLMTIRLAIDASEQIDKWGVKDEQGNRAQFWWIAYLIMATEATFKYGDEVREGYRPNYQPGDLPILIDYSKTIGQASTIPLEYLCIKEVTTRGKVIEDAPIKRSSRHTVITYYLIQRIEAMKHNDKPMKYKNRISLDTLYRECGIEDLDRRRLCEAREFVDMVLRYYKSIKYIEGFRKGSGNHGTLQYIDISI